MVEYLEQKLAELFERENLTKCLDRWKKTTRYVTKTEDAYLEALKLRLQQGGVEL